MQVHLLSQNIHPSIYTFPLAVPSSISIPPVFKHLLGQPLDLLNFHLFSCQTTLNTSLLFLLSVSFIWPTVQASLSSASRSIPPSLISASTTTDACRQRERKKHIFCHIAMSVKFRSHVFVFMCACLRFKGTFIIKFHFLCRQTLLPAA